MKKIKYIFFLQGFHFLMYNKFSWSGFLLFLGLGLKSAGLHFRKYKKAFFWENIRKYKESF